MSIPSRQSPTHAKYFLFGAVYRWPMHELVCMPDFSKVKLRLCKELLSVDAMIIYCNLRSTFINTWQLVLVCPRYERGKVRGISFPK